MKLGSLFDGSGGFPLAGVMCGITPVWASEVEPYPIRVTSARFPNMSHLGDITKINGGEIEPVDVITFGSPCQDLSVAGKRAGIKEGARSSLFFHAIRIIREMREATNGVHPRIIVWENVHGAYSSNKGEDFRAVLQALCKIADPGADVPRPPKGKWGGAGCIVGDGYSLAWRTYDAQYWGVPQRRRRIYLVADFRGERAGEVFFEPGSVRWNSSQGAQTREETAVHAAGGDCGGAAGRVGVFMGGQGDKAGGIAYSEDVAPTLRSAASGSNQTPDIVYPAIARTLTAEYDASPCVDRGQNFAVYAAGFSDSVGERAQGGMGYAEGLSPTLRAGDARAVVYAMQGNGIDRADTAGCNGCGWREGGGCTL